MDAVEKQLARHRASCALCGARKFCGEQARLLVTMGKRLVAHPPKQMRKDMVMPQAKVMYYLAALYLESMQYQEQNAMLNQQLQALRTENLELKKKYAPELVPKGPDTAEAPKGAAGKAEAAIA